jgi:DnaK suppressor protein
MAAFAASKRGRFPASGWIRRKSYKKYPSGSNLCASNVCCIFIQSIFEGVIEVDHTPKSARLYEEKLLQQKQLLEKSMLSAVEQGRAATAEDTQDPADQAVFSYQKELLFSQGTTGHMQLGQVKEAIRRLQDGNFGECMLCSTEIGVKRLEALPWTRYCINCQEKIENGEIDDPARAA